MANNDFALANNDFTFLNGDIATGPSDNQHIADTINAYPGWWKNNPEDGVGVFSYLNSSEQEQSLKKSLILNLQSDGYTVLNPAVSIKGDTITINPNATN